jgi:uncharacterized protein YkwD
MALAVLSSPAGAEAASSDPLVGTSEPYCPAESGLGAPPKVQERAMVCLVNGARRARGLAVLRPSAVLDRAAQRKSADILRCDEFSHEACGREFTYWMEHVGYLDGCSNAGENIAWGTGALGSVRLIFRAWMHSAGHRENILGDYEDVGIGLRVGRLEGVSGAHVWTQDFGSHC